MITEKDLHEAIAECQGQRNPNANTCIKLAAYYTILDHIKEREQDQEERDFSPVLPQYSYRASPVSMDEDEVPYNSDSEFGQKISGLSSSDLWPVMDELMSTLKVLHPRLYDGVMRKLDGLN